MRGRNGLLALLALLVAAGPVLAQTNPTGTISGKATDQQGLAMPGVTVTVESPALQGTRTAITSANGDYIFPFLPPGDYTVTVASPGGIPESSKRPGEISVRKTGMLFEFSPLALRTTSTFVAETVCTTSVDSPSVASV